MPKIDEVPARSSWRTTQACGSSPSKPTATTSEAPAASGDKVHDSPSQRAPRAPTGSATGAAPGRRPRSSRRLPWASRRTLPPGASSTRPPAPRRGTEARGSRRPTGHRARAAEEHSKGLKVSLGKPSALAREDAAADLHVAADNLLAFAGHDPDDVGEEAAGALMRRRGWRFIASGRGGAFGEKPRPSPQARSAAEPCPNHPWLTLGTARARPPSVPTREVGRAGCGCCATSRNVAPGPQALGGVNRRMSPSATCAPRCRSRRARARAATQQLRSAAARQPSPPRAWAAPRRGDEHRPQGADRGRPLQPARRPQQRHGAQQLRQTQPRPARQSPERTRASSSGSPG